MDTAVTGTPRILLRLEGVALLAAAVVAYHALGAPWWCFALLILVPDVALIAYAAGPRAGAFAYNAMHVTLGPAGLAAIGYFADRPTVWPVCVIWMAHIGLDRALGLGLKFASAFRDTHLGTVGRS